MKTSFRKSFTKDLKKIKDQELRDRIGKVIQEVEAAHVLSEITQLKKLSGTADCFRIRVGDYRVGLVLEKDTVDFVRCLHRRDLYRFFP